VQLKNFTKYENYIFAAAIWLVIFLFIFPCFNLGFDLTDEGWQLAKAWGILHGDFENNADLIWGSSFLNGLWMLIINKPSLIWSRIAYLLFIPFFGIISYMILKEFFPRKNVFFSVITAFLLFNKTFLIYSTANYYYLPVFASLLSFLLLIRFHKSEKPFFRYIILSGVLAGICIHLKFTYILIIPVFLIYFIWFNDKSFKLKSALYFYSSLFITVMIGFIFLFFQGGAVDLVYEHGRLSIFDMFGYFFGTSEVNSSLNYSAKNLFGIYLKDLASVINLAFVPIILLASSSYFIKIYPKIKHLVTIIFGVILYFYIFQDISVSHLKIISTVLGIGTLLLFFKPENSKLRLPYYIFISIFALSFLGSGTGFYAGVFSLGFFGFTAFAIVTATDYGSDRINAKMLLPAFITTSIILQIFKSYSPYRDLPSEYLNTEFKSSELIGIYSFKERVEAVDEFLDFVNKENIRENKVIFVAMPMFYYLLDVNPVISETHDVILGFEQLKKEVAEANPDIIVVPVQSPRGQLWPLPQNAGHWTKDGFEKQTVHYYKFYNNYITENNFEKIFENAMFIVYRKSDLLREEQEQ
jgi:hypothetical protein